MTLIRSGMPCPVCGTRHAACGDGSAVSAVDIPKEVARMPGPLKNYDVRYNGHNTTMKLNDHDAQLLGLLGAEPTPVSKEASSAGMDPDKLGVLPDGTPEPDPGEIVEQKAEPTDGQREPQTEPPVKRDAPPNKARGGTQNKG